METEPRFSPERNNNSDDEKIDETEKQEITKEIQEDDPRVEVLEESDAGPLIKRDFLLVLLGEKPITSMFSEVNVEDADEETKKELEKARSTLKQSKQVLEKMNMPVEVMETPKIEDGKKVGERGHIITGKNKKDVERAKKIFNKERDTGKRNEKEWGKLYGYPETAVEAFAKGEEYLVDRKKAQEILKEEGLNNFADFRLSKEHSEEEIELLKKREDLIKEISPQIHKEIKERHKE